MDLTIMSTSVLSQQWVVCCHGYCE